MRIPGWARNEPVPSDLYRFTRRDQSAPPTLARERLSPCRWRLDKGYVTIDRTWSARRRDRAEPADAGPPRRIRHDKVIADRDRVALQRGPIVYAAEWPDNPNGKVRNIVLPDAERAHHRVPAGPAERRAK